MKRTVFIGLIFYVVAMVFYGCSDKTTEPEVKKVATPEFNPSHGTYSAPQEVKISCKTEEAIILYTVDGTNPTLESAIYTNSIYVSKTSSITAIAYKEGWQTSNIATESYFVEGVSPSQGDGSVSNPYVISTLADLFWLSQSEDEWDKHFIQALDIDASETSIWNYGKGWDPIGTGYPYDGLIPFSGYYDGQGFTISKLYINQPEKQGVGFFGAISEATIHNISLKDIYVIGKGSVGGLIGRAIHSQIINCNSSGFVKAIGEDWDDFGVGGLIGSFCCSNVDNCFSSSIVNGIDSVGGLIGSNHGEVSNCYSEGYVKGLERVGGLVGWNFVSLKKSYSKADVDGVIDVGGLVGSNYGTIEIAYSQGKVNGVEGIGGLVGWNVMDEYIMAYGDIDNCFSNSDVFGEIYVGGLVGLNSRSTISNSYSTGSVTGNENVGGLVGVKWGVSVITKSYWDTQTSGLTESAGGKGRTTAEMTYPYTENTYEHWNFNNIWKADTGYSVNNGYPYLRW